MVDKVLRIGSYNAEFGHPKEDHAAMLWWRFHHLRLDALCISEARDYVPQLHKQSVEHRGRVLVKHDERGSDQQIILVREDAAVGGVWSIRAGLPYRMANGGEMAAEQPLCAYVDGALIISRHAPVQAWMATGDGRPHERDWTGPLGRRLAYRHSQRRILKVYRRHKHIPVLTFGDWNATPDTDGAWSPRWLRNKTGATFARPHRSTGHGEIDFGLVSNARVRSCRIDPNPHGKPHSDHLLVWAEVVY